MGFIEIIDADNSAGSWVAGSSVARARPRFIPRNIVELGLLALPGQFTDSDVFDGSTNGKGWGIFGAKEIYTRTDLGFSLFIGEAVNEDILWEPAVARANRVRLRTDARVSF